MMAPRSPKTGFTLVEMLVVLAILSVLTLAAVPLVKIAVQRENEIELHRNLRLIREAIDEYKKLSDEKRIEVKGDTEGYPPDLEILVKGVEVQAQGGEKGGKTAAKKIVRFLRRIPEDPMTQSQDWGLRSYQDAPDSDSWGKENVYDVYSKSPAKALDGTRYRDW